MREYQYKSIYYIAKSVDGRPTDVFIDEKCDNLVSVKPKPGAYDKPLFIPIGQVFEGDRDLLPKLKYAYESHDLIELHRLWKKAKPIKLVN